MRLVDLNPQWLDAGGEGITRGGEPVSLQKGIGVIFDCPCRGVHPVDSDTLFVPFDKALDGSAVHGAGHTWHREGDTFETLTLTPSILRAYEGGCKWHGYITNGEIITV